MKLQHKVLTAALALALCGLAGSASADQFSGIDGTVTINGAVIAQTCTVSNGGDIQVTLPNVLETALATAGNTAGDTAFTIGISGCDSSLATVQAAFSGGDINTGNGRLDNSATTAPATNVQVQMLNAGNTVMDLSQATGTGQGTSAVNLVTGAADLDFTARYYATGAATAGAVHSTVDFTLTYL